MKTLHKTVEVKLNGFFFLPLIFSIQFIKIIHFSLSGFEKSTTVLADNKK